MRVNHSRSRCFGRGRCLWVSPATTVPARTVRDLPERPVGSELPRGLPTAWSGPAPTSLWRLDATRTNVPTAEAEGALLCTMFNSLNADLAAGNVDSGGSPGAKAIGLIVGLAIGAYFIATPSGKRARQWAGGLLPNFSSAWARALGLSALIGVAAFLAALPALSVAVSALLGGALALLTFFGRLVAAKASAADDRETDQDAPPWDTRPPTK